MPQLESVFLGNNMLTGTVPNELVELPNLTNISIKNNLLHGDLNDVLRDNLYYFNANNNSFSGNLNMSEVLSRNPNLNTLELKDLKNLRIDMTGMTSSIRVVDFTQCNLSSTSIPETIVDGKSNVMQAFTSSYSQLQGTIPSEIGQLKDLTTLTLPGNDLTGQLPDTFVELVNLLSLHLADNRLSGPLPKNFGKNLVQLSYLDLSQNLFTGSLPVFESKSLGSVLLHMNRFARIPANVFEASGSELQFVTFANQDPYVNGKSQHTIILDEGAFSGVNLRRLYPDKYGSGTRLILTGNRIQTLPAYLFGNKSISNGSYVDLSNLGIDEIRDNAFAGLSNAYVNLVGNAIKKLLPTSFPMGSLDRSHQHCVDVEGWHVNVLLYDVVRLTCENVSHEALALQGSPSCDKINSTWPFCVPLAIGDRGVGGLSALQACCTLMFSHHISILYHHHCSQEQQQQHNIRSFRWG